METQVAIVGAGPAGLVLARLLELRGIDCVVLEARSREYVEKRVRAGVLEQRTVDCLDEAGVSARLHEEGMVHHGIELRFGGVGHRIDFNALTGGKSITVYGQQEVVKDLIAARLESELPLLFEVSDVAVDVSRPSVSFTHEGSCCRAVVRRDRGLRRLPRRLPRGDRRRADGLRARLSVRLARHPGEVQAVVRGADLREPRARVRAALDALPVGHALLPAVLARRGPRRLARRADLGGAQRALRARRRVLVERGRDLREGRHADALLRRRADAAREALPRRRRGPHRARRREPRG